ncbi:hypothetical protein DdX_20793 [Ditylenchus destructor]|uniref:Uncharacterized protein n=1 Tax=Ditylenchus destructor TaxID=166010 RepID=A0AAD4QRP3_9BILA|nr:hypothetical protein DdX_20793 [Ditylenchus destructor]
MKATEGGIRMSVAAAAPTTLADPRCRRGTSPPQSLPAAACRGRAPRWQWRSSRGAAPPPSGRRWSRPARTSEWPAADICPGPHRSSAARPAGRTIGRRCWPARCRRRPPGPARRRWARPPASSRRRRRRAGWRSRCVAPAVVVFSVAVRRRLASAADHEAYGPQRDGEGHDGQPDRIPPGGQADAGRRLLEAVVVPHHADAERADEREEHGDHQRAELREALAPRHRAAFGEVLDADVPVARHRGRAGHQRQHDHEEHRELFRPGEGRIGEVADDDVGKSDERQRAHDDDREPVLDGKGNLGRFVCGFDVGGNGAGGVQRGADSGGVVIAGWSVRHARTPCHRADAGTRSVHLDRETVTDARGSMTIHVSGVSLAGWPGAGFFGAAFGVCAQGAGYSPPRMSPGLRPPPLFRGGSTRRPVHGECGCGLGRDCWDGFQINGAYH